MILQANGFDWDRGNRAKCEKHGLSVALIEGLFARPLAILPDAGHSQRENRFRAVGRTEKGTRRIHHFHDAPERRGSSDPPLSARYMHKKEIDAFEKENPGL
jgi:uncharacterized DUF497 family protein